MYSTISAHLILSAKGRGHVRAIWNGCSGVMASLDSWREVTHVPFGLIDHTPVVCCLILVAFFKNEEVATTQFRRWLIKKVRQGQGSIPPYRHRGNSLAS
jgi:hypothetical protein